MSCKVKWFLWGLAKPILYFVAFAGTMLLGSGGLIYLCRYLDANFPWAIVVLNMTNIPEIIDIIAASVAISILAALIIGGLIAYGLDECDKHGNVA